MQRFSFVHIPLVYGSYSTSKVVTQERVEGVKISDVTALDAAGIDREALALNFFRALLQQVIFDGFFHADLHPGNVWVNLQTGSIIFLDMGMMGRLSVTDRFALGQLIWALQDRDARAVSRVTVNMCRPTRGYDTNALEHNVERLINRHLLLEDATADIAAIIADLVGLLVRTGLQLRKEFTLAFKAIGQGEAIMRTLMGDKPPDYVLDVAYSTMKDMLLAQLEPQTVRDLISKPLARDMIGRLPAVLSAASALLDDFQRGQSALQVNLNSVDQRVNAFQASLAQDIRRVVLSVTLVGLLLGCTLVLLVPFEGRVGEAENLAIRVTAVFGFVASAALIVLLLLHTLWQSLRRSSNG